jgi:hypothetical protein
MSIFPLNKREPSLCLNCFEKMSVLFFNIMLFYNTTLKYIFSFSVCKAVKNGALILTDCSFSVQF